MPHFEMYVVKMHTEEIKLRKNSDINMMALCHNLSVKNVEV